MRASINLCDSNHLLVSTANMCVTHYSTMVLAHNKQHLHNDVTDGGGAFQRVEGSVVGYNDGDVEGAQQYQPVPAYLEDAVVKQYEARPPHILYLILGQSVTS